MDTDIICVLTLNAPELILEYPVIITVVAVPSLSRTIKVFNGPEPLIVTDVIL